jgi:outer membrane protein OmpA-like peptidoglycan-associated protein
MSLNLLDLLKGQVTNQLSGQASKFLGEDEGMIGKALGGIFPSLLGSVIQKGSDKSGAESLMNLLSDQDDGILDNISGLFAGGGSSVNSLMGGGSNLLSGLLGDKVGGIVDLISSFSGLKKGSSSSLLKMAAPFLMSFLGKQVKSQGIGTKGLMKLLKGQKENVASALPAGAGSLLGLSGFNLGGMAKNAFGDVSDGVGNLTEKTVGIGSDALDTGKKVGGSLLKWLIPLILLLVVLGWFGIKTCTPIDNATEMTKDAATGAIETINDAAGEVANVAGDATNAVVDAAEGAIAASSEFINSTIQNVNEAGLSALGKVKFMAGSAGEKMKNYIDGGANGTNEFNFGQLSFESGSAKITASTANEIDNIAAILKAYPGLNIAIEGHTDSTGTDETNKKISNARAEAVKNRLIIGGIDGNRISTFGHGSSKPIADNSTEEGKNQNRRIVVRIVK